MAGTEAMTAGEVMRRFAAGERDFTYANLSDANLSDANLSDANLRNADLRNADLRNADLRGANLRNADLSGAKNLPTSSHDLIAEVLRQAAGLRYDRLQVAGLPLVTRDWCWAQYQRIALAHWPVEVRRWIVETLAPLSGFEGIFTEYPFLTAEEIQAEAATQEQKREDCDDGGE